MTLFYWVGLGFAVQSANRQTRPQKNRKKIDVSLLREITLSKSCLFVVVAVVVVVIVDVFVAVVSPEIVVMVS